MEKSIYHKMEQTLWYNIRVKTYTGNILLIIWVQCILRVKTYTGNILLIIWVQCTLRVKYCKEECRGITRKIRDPFKEQNNGMEKSIYHKMEQTLYSDYEENITCVSFYFKGKLQAFRLKYII
jgi:hypothetical protein